MLWKDPMWIKLKQPDQQLRWSLLLKIIKREKCFNVYLSFYLVQIWYLESRYFALKGFSNIFPTPNSNPDRF